MRSQAVSRFFSLAVVLLLGVAGTHTVVAQSDDDPDGETIVSRSLRFEGKIVGKLPSGAPMREFAFFRGRKFSWVRDTGERKPVPEEVKDDSEDDRDPADMSFDELARNLRGIALFNGHEFVESEPAYDLALAVKQQVAVERGVANPDVFQIVYPGIAASQGTAPRTRDFVEVETPRSADIEPALPGPAIVHGVDDRTVMNNLAYPHRTHIVFDNAGSTAAIESSQGSGTLIGPSTAMSVAHVFWDEANNTWEADHRWAPGYDSQDADRSPWGEWYRCYWVTIPSAYTVFESHAYDYAVLDFDVGCNSVSNGVNSDHPGSVVGWLGHYTASAGSIEARTGFVRGYPGTGTCGSAGGACNVRVWGDFSASSENDATSNAINHFADTSGGQSGSGFYHYADPSCGGCGFGAYLVGMHRAGSAPYNIARRFTSAVYTFMRAYSSDY